jgi:hypothetical protein
MCREGAPEDRAPQVCGVVGRHPCMRAEAPRGGAVKADAGAGDAACHEAFALRGELVEHAVELRVVRAPHVVRDLVEHRAQDVLVGQERVRGVVWPQAHADLARPPAAAADIEALRCAG